MNRIHTQVSKTGTIPHRLFGPVQSQRRHGHGTPQRRARINRPIQDAGGADTRIRPDLNEYDCTPLLDPAYDNGTAIRREGQVDVVESAGCLGDTIGSDREEAAETDTRMSAATKMWHALKRDDMLMTSWLSKQAQGSVHRACVVQVLLSTTENWAMRAVTYQRL